MAVNLPALGSLPPVSGVRVGTAGAGIKQCERDDVAVFLLAPDTVVAGVFTRSAFRAAPVQIASANLATGGVRALVINSGNANAATGAAGLADAQAVCRTLADAMGIDQTAVLPFSTGVIGERLPVNSVLKAVERAADRAAEDGWPAAASAILTTDTGPKAVSRQVPVQGCPVTINGIAKGAGMIRPDMATMLAFVCCDASVTSECLEGLTREVADRSFNRISIDGDTSTNDSFVVCASGVAGNALITSADDPGYQDLREGLSAVAVDLATRIVRDGEGATKFVTIRVRGGADTEECLRVAYTIAESPLVKTAVFAGDPNWGRFCMAIGRSGVKDLDTGSVDLYLNDVCVARGGLIAPDYTEADGARVMAQDEFEIRVELGRGDAEEVVWTCDLSYEYVRINAEYRT